VADVCAAAAASYGLDLSRFDEAFLWSLFDRRRHAAGLDSLEAYAAQLATDGAEAEALRESLRVTYSELFRDPLTFAFLEQVALPLLIEQRLRAGRGELRVWSAGCAAGQEAWSLAILLDSLAAATGQQPAYRIVATDLSEPELAAARDGVYPPEALRNVRQRHLDAYFERRGNSNVIADRLRERVEFSRYDLLDAATSNPPAGVYGDFDVVVCANLLFYYRPQARHMILNKIKKSLAPWGFFVTGETERQLVEARGGFRAATPPLPVFRHAEAAL
jgi:chemotaxis protein methyltransferase CheR